ncbi:MAG: hypothetical protein WDW36_008953 [Sanguina aurantia]
MSDTVQYVTANDGARLAYEVSGPVSAPVVVLLHGWSGSRKYFSRNIRTLSSACRVYALDQRFHGDSDSTSHGHHVARLAADLNDFLTCLNLEQVVVVGTSLGCAVIWSYIELYGEARLKGAVTVDQAPLQNRSHDWQLGSNGCYDATTLANLQAACRADVADIATGNMGCCCSLPIPDETAALLRAETLRCSGEALALLMADHTQLDWRALLARIRIPFLNCVGGCSGVFPTQGCLYVGEQVPDGCNVLFSRASHWLHIEQPGEFCAAVLGFVENGNDGRAKLVVVP